MGIWGGIFGALGAAAPFIAAPFTGGASLALAPAIWSAGITAGAGLAGNIYGARTQSSAARQAAEQQAASAKYAADLQAKASADALAFTRQQAELQNRNWIEAQNANYAQYAAREGRLTPYRAYGQSAAEALGNALGLDPSQIAPPPPAPRFSSFGGDTSGAGASGPAVDRNAILAGLKSVYDRYGVQPTGRGTGPTDIDYMADRVAETGGWQGGNAGYWTDRIGQELLKSGQLPASYRR